MDKFGVMPRKQHDVQVREVYAKNGAVEPTRAIDVLFAKGLHIRILPDRGMDILDCRFLGRPLHWLGPGRDAPAKRFLTGHEWESFFMGGLLTTCGLFNVGEPSEGYGLHGMINHRPASDIRWQSVHGDNVHSVAVCGSMIDTSLDGKLIRLERKISISDNPISVRVDDVVTNLSQDVTPAPYLYHLNFGAPFVGPDTQIKLQGHIESEAEFGELCSLENGWMEPFEVVENTDPVTVEHMMDDRPIGEITIQNSKIMTAAHVSWCRKSMPRLFQWININKDDCVVALEPSNASTKGRAHDRVRGRLSCLEPGEIRRTWVEIQFEKTGAYRET